MHFGERIRELRENQGLLQRQLAANIELADQIVDFVKDVAFASDYLRFVIDWIKKLRNKRAWMANL